MAGEVPPLNVEVLVSLGNLTNAVNQATEGMTKISNVAKESSEKASSSFTKLKDVMLGVFGGNLLTSGVMGLQKTLVDMNQAVQDAQVETLRLDTALKNSGNTSALVKTQVDATVKSYANLGFTHAQASQAMGTLVTATGNVTESTKLMTMAADLARYKHEDLNTAATTLARGTQGSVKAFKELGITLDSTLPKNEAIAKAFDELNQKIGGQAVSYTHTFAGEMAVLKEKFNEAAVTVGNVLFPIVGKLVQLFMDAMKVVGDLISLLKPFIDFIKENAAAFEILVGVIGTAVAIWKTYELAVKAAQVAEEGLAIATAALGNPFAIITIAVAALAAGFVALWNHSETFRKAVTEGIKIVVEAFGYLVGAIGKVIEAATHLPFIGGHFKGIANAVNEAAVSIGKFGQGLDGLANKKISLPSFLGGTDSSVAGSAGGNMGVGGSVPGGDVAKGAAAATNKIKTAQDNVIKLQDEQNKILLDRQTKMDTAITDLQTKQLDAHTKFDQTKLDIETKYQDAIEAATTAHNDAIEKANEAHQDNIISINQAALDKQKAIIQQSIDAMTSGFASVTKFDLAKSFSGTGTTSGLIASMQYQLTQIVQLQKDAGDLAAKGYSQSFINQVIAQGPLVGDQMSQAILNATPQTADQIKSLYAQIDTVSNSGLDTLAQTMNDGTTFATSAMAKQYAQVAVDLQNSLADENNKYQDSLNAAQDTFNNAMTSAGNARDLALQKAQQVLTDSLTSAQQAYDKSIQAISDSTMSKLDALMAKMLAAQALLAKLGAPTPTTSVPAGTFTAAPLTYTTAGGFSVPNAAPIGPGLTINAPITVDGSTAPSQIQSSVLSLAKLGALANGSGTGY